MALSRLEVLQKKHEQLGEERGRNWGKTAICWRCYKMWTYPFNFSYCIKTQTKLGKEENHQLKGTRNKDSVTS